MCDGVGVCERAGERAGGAWWERESARWGERCCGERVGVVNVCAVPAIGRCLREQSGVCERDCCCRERERGYEW